MTAARGLLGVPQVDGMDTSLCVGDWSRGTGSIEEQLIPFVLCLLFRPFPWESQYSP